MCPPTPSSVGPGFLSELPLSKAGITAPRESLDGLADRFLPNWPSRHRPRAKAGPTDTQMWHSHPWGLWTAPHPLPAALGGRFPLCGGRSRC